MNLPLSPDAPLPETTENALILLDQLDQTTSDDQRASAILAVFEAILKDNPQMQPTQRVRVMTKCLRAMVHVPISPSELARMWKSILSMCSATERSETNCDFIIRVFMESFGRHPYGIVLYDSNDEIFISSLLEMSRWRALKTLHEASKEVGALSDQPRLRLYSEDKWQTMLKRLARAWEDRGWMVIETQEEMIEKLKSCPYPMELSMAANLVEEMWEVPLHKKIPDPLRWIFQA